MSNFPLNSKRNNPFQGNALLAELPDSSLARLSPHLRPQLFQYGVNLFEAGSKSELVYFPKSGLLSLVLTSDSGIDVEVGLVGSEGGVGLIDALSERLNSARAQVQVAGSGWQLPSAVLRQEFCDEEMRLVFLRYQSDVSSASLQNTLCNRLHSVEQRFAKWLLLAQDRMPDRELELTHEFMATMLGSRRATVTLTAQSFRDIGLIDYKRGSIFIVDAIGLEKIACECCSVLRKFL